MKFTFTLILGLLLIACNQQDSSNKNQKDTTTTPAQELNDTSSKQVNNDERMSDADSALLRLSKEILSAIKSSDWTKLASFADQNRGIRFSPYGFIDTTSAITLRPANFIAATKQHLVFKWGAEDGSGKPIRMTLQQYVDRYVYSKDFLNAPQQSINESKGGGNSLDNLKNVYPKASYIEYYFPGTDKYGGMDWQNLKLVFESISGKPTLVAIVHDEWTI